jgi:hypothetical protein
LANRALALDDVEAWRTDEPARQRERESELLEISLATVITAHSSVEAAVNELYLERTEFDNAVWFVGLPEEIAGRFNAAWSDGVRRLNPIEKARLALSIAGVQNFQWGSGGAQSLRFLHDLRNALLHHKPFTVERSAGASDSDPLEAALTKRFQTAAIWRERNVTFRWAGCLGGDCARWAAETAMQFQSEFFGALGCSYPSASVSHSPA